MKTKQRELDIQLTVIVAGAQGVSGRAVLERYAAASGTTVYGLSRRPANGEKNVRHISVDLLDAEDVYTKLGHLKAATHLVFAAYIEKPTAAERTEINVRLLQNVLDILEASAPGLKHIAIYQGGKAYGSDLGPYKTPAREDDPRLMPPNFYYEQEDLLRSRQKANKWNFTVLRPGGVLRCLVLNHVPVLDQDSTLNSENIRSYPIYRFPKTRKPSVGDHEIALGQN
jgi:nucleoside-diphosphate-sugar epimerase